MRQWLSFGLVFALLIGWAMPNWANSKPKVAVVNLESVGVEPSTGVAAAEILSTHLGSREHLFVLVERAQLQKTLQELGYQASAFVDPNSAITLGKQLGARYIVLGSVTRFGGSYSLNVRIVDVQTTETRSVSPVSVPSLSPEAVIRLGDSVALRLNDMIQPGATPALPVQTPSSYGALKPGEMLRIPAGPFIRGDQQKLGQGDESPVRTLYLETFDIGRYEVTQAEYKRFIDATGHRAPTTCDFGKVNWNPAEQPNHPVVCVSWYDAQAYCQWGGQRLPTEAEWEKAARGSKGLLYPWGDNKVVCDRAAFSGCMGEEAGLRPVGSKSPGTSPYGLYDMAGNVWEWVQDWYDPNYYRQAPDHNPPGPAQGKTKVLRGGGFGHDPSALRASNRSDIEPTHRNESTGFRCVR